LGGAADAREHHRLAMAQRLKEPMPAQKNQHFVPRCALRPFTLNGEGAKAEGRYAGEEADNRSCGGHPIASGGAGRQRDRATAGDRQGQRLSADVGRAKEAAKLEC
jgi:hypothetical protein